jgi:hypothetical protein
MHNCISVFLLDFEQFFKGRRNHHTLCRLRFVFHSVKNYGKLFLNLAPAQKKEIKYVPPPLAVPIHAYEIHSKILAYTFFRALTNTFHISVTSLQRGNQNHDLRGERHLLWNLCHQSLLFVYQSMYSWKHVWMYRIRRPIVKIHFWIKFCRASTKWSPIFSSDEG